MSVRHAGMVKEIVENPNEKVEVTYMIMVIDEPLEVFPETIEKMKGLDECLTEPIKFAESVREIVKKDDEKAEDKKARVFYGFIVSQDAESYWILRSVTIGNYRWLHQTAPKELNDTELKTQLKYALKIRELGKMLDDCNKKLEQYKINKEREEGK